MIFEYKDDVKDDVYTFLDLSSLLSPPWLAPPRPDGC